MTRVCFNGKFLSAKPTGVHRVAEELILGVDRLLAADPELGAGIEWEMLCPKDADRELDLSVIRRRTVGHLTWQVWEQFELPFYASPGLLVSLCNLAPVGKKHAITMIHDAQTFITPESYSLPFRTWYQFALPRIGRHNRRILTVSDFSRGQLADYGIAPAEKIDVLYNGLDHVEGTPPDGTITERLGLGGAPFALGLANTQAHKNLGVVLKAFARPELRDYKLVLFGAADREAFEAAGHDVPPNVVFAGFVSESELAGLLRAASMMVFPSTTEGFGLPPLEAMLVGTPAICAPCGALPEVCGEAAAYADPDDPDAWAKAIAEHFAMSGDETARLGEAAMAQASQFRWEKSARKLLDLIKAELV